MVDRALRFDLLGRDKSLGRTLDQGHRKIQRFGTGLTKLAALAGGAFAGVAITAGIKSTIDAASDLNESISKTRVVFGKSSKAVELFARGAAKNLGQSRQQALEATATFGNLFVSMKLGQKPAADMSVKIVRLASDLASFNNVDPAEALDALRSGLVGETEPLRRFGINLNDATLRQEALRLGLTKTTKEVLPPAIRAQAAYSLIMQQSKTAQGDFARTSQGAANQQRIFAARIQDLKANIGRGLLPVFSTAIAFINTKLVPAVSGFATTVREKVGPAIAALTRGVQQKLGGFKLVPFKVDLENLAARAKGWANAIIGGFKTGLRTGDWSDLGEIIGNVLRTAVGNGINLIKRAFGGVDWFKVGKEATFVAVPFAFGFFDSLLSALFKQFKEHPWESTMAVLALIPLGRATGALAKVLGKLPILGPLLRGLERAGGLIEKPVFGIVGAITRSFGRAIESAFPGIGRRIGDWAVRWILGISSRVGEIRKAGGVFITGLRHGILDQAGLVIRNIAQVIGWVTKPFRSIGGWLVRRGVDLVGGLVRGVGATVGSVARMVGAVISRLTSPFRRAGGWLIGAGHSLISGLVSGIRSAIGSVGGVLRSLKDAIVGGIKRLFGIRSPSSVMAGLGANMVAGLVRGLISNQGSLRTIIKSIGGNVMDWFGSAFGGALGGIGQGGTSGNIQKLAQRMAAGYGWSGAQWSALRTLVQHESGWNPGAQNPTSTAYGLFQFLDSTWSSVGATKTSSPVGQIAAGLRYIKQRYGSPLGAWDFWQGHHWYGKGVEGIFSKPTLIGVGERGPEAVSVKPLGRAGSPTHVQVDVTLQGAVMLTDRRAMQQLANELERPMRTAMLRAQRRIGNIGPGLR
jgi:SLT domain-containing protein